MAEAEPRFFKNPTDFRAWLEEFSELENELWVGYFKVATGKASLTWEQSVEEALCFGWIDGIRKSINADSYKIRFTPRRKNSFWSKKNVDTVQLLIQAGRMQPQGLAAFEARDLKKSGYSFEQPQALEFSAAFLKNFKANPKAHIYFEAQPPGYQKAIKHWVMSAKKEETQRRRFSRVLEMSFAQERIDLSTPFGGTSGK